jgi:hypothetical protein
MPDHGVIRRRQWWFASGARLSLHCHIESLDRLTRTSRQDNVACYLVATLALTRIPRFVRLISPSASSPTRQAGGLGARDADRLGDLRDLRLRVRLRRSEEPSTTLAATGSR